MPVTIRQVALWTAATLGESGIPDSRLEAEVLIRHVLSLDRAQYFASLGEPVNARQIEFIRTITEHRIAGEPLAYIIGHREFYGLKFAVSPAVLIPRQETELLVDIALEFARGRDGSTSIADVGTGSGAIAIAIAANDPDVRVFAIDCCADALGIADRNRHAHSVTDKVELLQGDLLEPLTEPADLIVSNPPYIARHLLPNLAKEVQREPRIALDGGSDGLAIIRRLLNQASSRLKKGGLLAMEISPEQIEPVSALVRDYFHDAVLKHHNDLPGLPRCITVRRKK